MAILTLTPEYHSVILLYSRLMNNDAGFIAFEQYSSCGLFNSSDDPDDTIIIRSRDISITMHYHYGILHNYDEPSVILESKDTIIKTWFVDGKRHRIGGPWIEMINTETNKTIVYWGLNDRSCKDIRYYANKLKDDPTVKKEDYLAFILKYSDELAELNQE